MQLPNEDDMEIVSNSNGTAYKFKNGLNKLIPGGDF